MIQDTSILLLHCGLDLAISLSYAFTFLPSFARMDGSAMYVSSRPHFQFCGCVAILELLSHMGVHHLTSAIRHGSHMSQGTSAAVPHTV